MTVLYRLMGAVARLSERLSHTRINFVPLNLIAVIILAVVFCMGLTETRDAVVNGNTPRVADIADVLAHKDVDRNFVTVRGLLVPGVGFQKARKSDYGGDSEVESSYIVLLDVKEKRALLVQRSGDSPDAEPKEMQVTGMLIPLESELRTKLTNMGSNIDGVPIDTEYMLEEGHQPGSASTWIGVTAVTGVLLALFLVTFLNRYVVFQKTAVLSPASLVSAPAAVPQQGIDLRVTGKFTLDAKNAKRFLNVPSGMVTLDTGEIALVSNIDASSKFFGVTTAKRAGLWAIVLQPGSLGRLDQGSLYIGLAARPAFRVHYKDSVSNAPSSAILSFFNAAERETFLSELSRLAGYSLSSTGVS